MLSPHYTTPPPQNATPVPTLVPRPPRGIPKGGARPPFGRFKVGLGGKSKSLPEFFFGGVGVYSFNSERIHPHWRRASPARPAARPVGGPPAPARGRPGPSPSLCGFQCYSFITLPPGLLQFGLPSAIMRFEREREAPRPRSPEQIRVRHATVCAPEQASAAPPIPPAQRCRPLTGR